MCYVAGKKTILSLYVYACIYSVTTNCDMSLSQIAHRIITYSSIIYPHIEFYLQSYVGKHRYLCYALFHQSDRFQFIDEGKAAPKSELRNKLFKCHLS